MRSALVLLFALTAGCIQVDVDEGAEDDGGSSQSQQCINGVCRTCTDDVCSGPLEDLRQEAAKQHADVEVQETHDLTSQPTDLSWSFWVDANATSHVVLRAVDVATGQVSVVPTVCVSWDHRTPSSQNSGSTGNCSGVGNIAISGGTLTDGTLLSWQSLKPGHYGFTVSAPPQPNQLIVDIVVDNP